MDRDDLVELRKFPQVHDAELAISTLAAADIPALLRDSSYGGIRVETLAHGITVLVRRDQRDAALQVLESGAEARNIDEAAPFECAGCGRLLPSAAAACPECNAEDHATVLTPERTRAAIGTLKLFVVLGTLALMIAPVILRRLGEIHSDVWVIVTYVVVGIAAVLFIFTILGSSYDRRL
jgi:hypothetical protein